MDDRKYEEAVNKFTDDCKIDRKALTNTFNSQKDFLITRRERSKEASEVAAKGLMGSTLFSIPVIYAVSNTIETGVLTNLPYVTGPIMGLFAFMFVAGWRGNKQITNNIKNDVKKFEEHKTLPPRPTKRRLMPPPEQG